MNKKIFGILIITLFITCAFTTTAISTNFTNAEKNNEILPANFEEQTFERDRAYIGWLYIENPTSVKYIKLTKLLYLNVKIEGGKAYSPGIRLFKSWLDFAIYKGEYGEILDIDHGKIIKTINIPIMLLQDDVLGGFQYVKNPDGTSLLKILGYGSLHPKIIWES